MTFWWWRDVIVACMTWDERGRSPPVAFSLCLFFLNTHPKPDAMLHAWINTTTLHSHHPLVVGGLQDNRTNERGRMSRAPFHLGEIARHVAGTSMSTPYLPKKISAWAMSMRRTGLFRTLDFGRIWISRWTMQTHSPDAFKPWYDDACLVLISDPERVSGCRCCSGGKCDSHDFDYNSSLCDYVAEPISVITTYHQRCSILTWY